MINLGMTLFLTAGDASAQVTNELGLECDLVDEQTVYWSAMSQAVTLRTHIKSTDGGLPNGSMKLILEDGTEINLGKGSKYIDDAPNEIFQNCNNHLEAATEAILKSLSESARFKTLSSLDALSAVGQDCMDDINLPDDGPSNYCLDAAQIHQALLEASLDLDMDNAQFTRLRDNSAPLITVTRSTYYSETYVYDAQANRLHKVLTEGC